MVRRSDGPETMVCKAKETDEFYGFIVSQSG
jgi:hypothetical protein